MPESVRKYPELQGRVQLVKPLRMVPLESIARGYFVGSVVEARPDLAEKYMEGEKLDHPLWTPSTKASGGEHDVLISEAKAQKLVGYEACDHIKTTTMFIYKKARNFLSHLGVVLCDFKLEFGYDESGELCVADELLTPDSSRYKVGGSHVDKQLIRNYLLGIDFDKKTPAVLPDHLLDTTKQSYASLLSMVFPTDS